MILWVVSIPERWHATGMKDLLSFSMSETMTEDNIDTVMIEIITDEEVATGMISYTSSIVTVEMGGKILGSQICRDFSI